MKTIGHDYENLRFNVAIAHIFALTNDLSAATHGLNKDQLAPDVTFAIKEAADFTTQAIAPIIPHLAEECWALLGNKTLLALIPWPQTDSALVQDNHVTIAVQVNGKRRGEITIGIDADEAVLKEAALALDTVQKALENMIIMRIIIVPQRIINVVVKPTT